MQRVVSIYLPYWSIDRYRRQLGVDAPLVELPLVMVGRKGSQRLIMRMNEAAADAGLQLGMPVGKAQALVSGLIVEPLHAAKDAAALEQVALWLMRRYTPIVAVDGDDGLVLETSGADHLHGGEEAMLNDIVQRLSQLGVKARIAISDTWAASYGLARFGKDAITLVGPSRSVEALRPLPIEALRLEQETIRSLKTMGLYRIADILKHPRAPLVLRFGKLLGERLDMLGGMKAEVFDPLRSEEVIELRKVFIEPIFAQESIISHASRLIEELCSKLERKGLGARCIDLLIQGVDRRIQKRRISMARPVRASAQMIRQLSDRLNDVDSGFGIEMLSLVVSHAEPLNARQIGSNLLEDADHDISGALDLIANRGHRIYRYAAVQSDVPERSVRCVGAFDAGMLDAHWHSEWPRPARLLPRPELIQTLALMPDHPPRSFTWRGMRHQVKCADGPERVFGEWWKRDRELHAVRDYFRVEDEKGERFWIFRNGDGEHAHSGSHEWFLHGIFG